MNPADRSRVLTEQRHPGTRGLHASSVRDCVRLITAEDAQVHEAMRRAEDALARLIEAIEPGFVRGGRLIYVGAGTSGRLGVLDAAEAPPTFDVEPGRVVGVIAGGEASLRRSSEGAEDDPAGAVPALEALAPIALDAVVGIAAGGTTPYVLGALDWAAALRPAPVVGLIACTPMTAPPGVEHLVILETGPEVLTGSTRMKAGTATKLALNTLSTTLMVRSGRVYENLMVDLRATNGKLRDRGARIIAELTGLDRPASLALLERAGGRVKTAVAMAWRSIDRDAAERLLSAHDGRLERVRD